MKADSELYVAFTLGVVVMFVVMVGIFGAVPEASIVKHGCGEYSKTTGDFQWIDKKER